MSKEIWQAKYRGTCRSGCGVLIKPGDWVTWDEAGEHTVHLECEKQGKKIEVCPICFLTSCDHGKDD